MAVNFMYQLTRLWCPVVWSNTSLDIAVKIDVFNIYNQFTLSKASQVALVVKNPLASVGDVRDLDSFPGLGRSPGGGHGNLLLYSCLENPHG